MILILPCSVECTLYNQCHYSRELPNDFDRNYSIQGQTIVSYAVTHNRSIHFIRPVVGREIMCLSYALLLGIAHCQKNKNNFIYLIYPGNVDSFTEESLAFSENEKIRYIDVCSLYSYVLKYFPMPIGVLKNKKSQLY